MTPRGRAAIASLRVTGPGALACVGEYFQARNGRRLEDQPVRRIMFGCWERTDRPGEDVVVARVDDAVEIHCHGGALAVRSILDDLVRSGATLATTDEIEPSVAAEAMDHLADALTERTALVLLDQLNGALAKAIQRLSHLLQAGRGSEALHEARELNATASFGHHLTRPFQVVISGLPNVGKSSLINAIVGYERAIVFDQPGTTRDVLTADTAIDGWPVTFMDTAGIRIPEDPIEQLGIDKAHQHMQAADLSLIVLDASQPIGTRPSCHETGDQLVVFNKTDLRQPGSLRAGEVAVSALTGIGIPELLDELSRKLVPHPPQTGQAVVFSERQSRILDAAIRRLEAGAFDDAVRQMQSLLGPVVT